MKRATLALVLCGMLGIAGCAGDKGASAPTDAAAPRAGGTMLDLQRQIDSLKDRVDLLQEQVRELQKASGKQTF